MPSSSSSDDRARTAVTGRGTGWVVGQFALMGAIIAAGFVPPAWPEAARPVLSFVGAVLALAGTAGAGRASRVLGRSFTPFPKPVEEGLVTKGPFGVVRHPVYAGGLALFTGYAVFASVPALVLTICLGVLWARKARLE